MSDDQPASPLRAPLGQLERALIDEFLRARGYDPSKVDELPAPERDALLKKASLHASAKLTEIEARSHFLDELQDGAPTAQRSFERRTHPDRAGS